jgi:ssDNA-binding Zn-finger/Zn-ribbon topoisomerase 1
MSNEIAVVEHEAFSIAPVGTVEAFEKRLNELRDFCKRNLVEGADKDFGKVPGIPKKVLFKSGAEKLLRWHGLVVEATILPSSKLDVLGSVIDIDMTGLVRHAATGTVLGTVPANCNSEERRYRNARLSVDKEGHEREPQTLGDQKNTLVKMCDKRLEVAAALKYTMASEVFTQDVEDMETEEKAEKPAKPLRGYGVCPRCGKGEMVEKSGKKGQFYGCSRYPDCRHTQNARPPSDSEVGATREGGEVGSPPSPTSDRLTLGELITMEIKKLQMDQSGWMEVVKLVDPFAEDMNDLTDAQLSEVLEKLRGMEKK